MKNISFLALILWICSCNSKDDKSISYKTSSAQNKTSINSLESFEVFNKKFHSDSLFQIKRIAFPIEGKQVDVFEERGWTPQNWIMMKHPVGGALDTSEYKSLIIRTDTSIKEMIWIEDSGFSIEREFRRRNGKWFLVLYNDVNI